MLSYRVESIESFSLIGLDVELTPSQKLNYQICRDFWQQFNQILRNKKGIRGVNWTKYAIMKRVGDKIFYYCGVPSDYDSELKSVVIEKNNYLVFEHVGPMYKIKDTYQIIYKSILPMTTYQVKQDQFLHFEKYGHNFSFNRNNSIIEIWIPIDL